MRMRWFKSMAPLLGAIGLLLAGCGGDDGAAGPVGPRGPEGPQGVEGPAGPLGQPPVLTGLEPTWGSASTQVRINGADLYDPDLGTAEVYVGGVLANVVSEDPLVFEPGVVVDERTPVVVTVGFHNQFSNGLMFELVRPGTGGCWDTQLPPVIVDAVEVGGVTYLASPSSQGENGGLYAMDADGWVTRIWNAPTINTAFTLPFVRAYAPRSEEAFDGPVILAADGNDVLMVTEYGSIKRFEPDTGDVTEELWFMNMAHINGFWPVVLDFEVDAQWFYLLYGNGNLQMIDRQTGVRSTIGGLNLNARAIARDADSLYVLAADGRVDLVEDPGGLDQFVVAGWGSTGAPGSYNALERLGDRLIIGGSEPTLMSMNTHAPGADDIGAAEPWGHPDGYGYSFRLQRLHADLDGNLYLVQGGAGVLRRIDAVETFAHNIAPAARLHFGMAQLGERWYLTSIGEGLFRDGLGNGSAAYQDGFVIELREDGAARILLEGGFPAGLLPRSDTELYVSDCEQSTISVLDVTTSEATVLLDADDGLDCPAGLVLDGEALLYVNAVMNEPQPSTVGRYVDGINDPDFVDGLPAGAVQLVALGGTLFSAPFVQGDANGVGYYGLFGAPLTGGTATEIVPHNALGRVLALAVSPDGRLFASRLDNADIVEIDPDQGKVRYFGSTWIGWNNSFTVREGMPFGAMSMAFLDDGTLLTMEMGQGTGVALAP